MYNESLSLDEKQKLEKFLTLIHPAGVQPWLSPDQRRGPGDIYGLTFQNISMAAPSVLGEQEVIWGMEEGLVYGLVFDNVTIGQDTVDSVDYFYHNQYVLSDFL